MIFNEIYSVYYQTVARILTAAQKGVTEKELQQIVLDNAFPESVLTILPSLKLGKWQLLQNDLSPVTEHEPTLPMTLLEKQWLTAILNDPRIRLFDLPDFPLGDVGPLFTAEDYRIYDQYLDGDPFTDETYIQNFRLVLEAIHTKRPIKLTMINHKGKEVWVRCFPTGFEYSMKDDKFRIIAEGCKFSHFNMARILRAEYYLGNGPWKEEPLKDTIHEVTLEITDERNALERAMLHFAHFEKRAERLNEEQYLLHMKYYGADETEIVIRILSFGPCVKVVGPDRFVDLIKNRLIKQKNLDLK